MGDDLVDQLHPHRGTREHYLVDDDESFLPDDQVRPSGPTEAELESHYVAPGESALLPVGIVYHGDWKTYADGMSRHVREQSLTLSQSGLPVWLQNFGLFAKLETELHPDVIEQVGHLRFTTMSEVAVAIHQMVLSSSQLLRSVVLPAGARLSSIEDEDRVYECTVVYTSWERDRVFPQIVEILNRCGQIWVPCEANRRAFEMSGVMPDKLYVMPYPYDPSTHPATKIPVPRGREEVPDGKRFYNIGKWEPRKNQHGLIGAFLCAFTPKDRASLQVKTYGWGEWEGYPSLDQSMAQWASDERVRANGWTEEKMNRRVRIIADKVSEERITELHRTNNIYVSAAFGEAWDIPAFDAKCAGNRLVYVGFGGPEDYAQDDDVLIEHGMGPVHATYGWEPEAQWAAYSEEQLADALRRAQPPTRRTHPRDFYNRFSRSAVGPKMRAAMRELVNDVDETGTLWTRLEEAGAYG